MSIKKLSLRIDAKRMLSVAGEKMCAEGGAL